MARQSKALQYADPTFELSKNTQELAQQVHVMAKFADARLRAIEVARHEKGFRNIESFAYKKAVYEIQHFTGAKENAKRFDTIVDLSSKGAYKQLQARANALREFINSPTSTKRGIKRVYDKRVKTINQKYGTDFDWQSLATFFEHGGKNILDKYGSDVVLMTVAEIQKPDDKRVKAIKDYNKRVKVSNMDKELKSVAQNMQSDGFDWSILE